MRFATAALLATAIGVGASVTAAIMPHPVRLAGVPLGDIGLPLAGIDRMAHGASPYDVRLRKSTPALYPLTTMVVLAPLRLLPLRIVVPCFAGVVSFFLAFAIARRGEPWQLLLFLSPAYWSALYSVQWSPLLTAALLLPPLLPFALVKPQLGVVLAAAGRWTKWTIGASVALFALSLMLRPTWPAEWIRHGNLKTFNGVSPVTLWPGVLLVSALALWRHRDGRLLLAMAVIVQRYHYDQLPLYLVAKSWRQLVLLLVTSWTAVAVVWNLQQAELATGMQLREVWIAVLIGVFIPSLVVAFYNHRDDVMRRAGVSGDPQSSPVET